MIVLTVHQKNTNGLRIGAVHAEWSDESNAECD
jgi:hypothetical protein